MTVCNCLLYPLLVIVGVPTNALSVLVFWRQGLRERMNLCLFGLAILDMSYLLVLMMEAAGSFVSMVDNDVGAEYTAYSLVYCLGIGWGLKAASGCISVLIAMDRCLCVLYPLRVESLMRTRTMAVLLVTIVLTTQLAQLVQPLAYTVTVISLHDVNAGQLHWSIVSTGLHAENRVLFDFLLVVLLPFIIPVISFIIVSVATAITVAKLKSAARWRAKNCHVASSTRVDHRDDHTDSLPRSATRTRSGSREIMQSGHETLTKVLVLHSCVYIACAAPLVAVTLVRLLVPGFSPDGRYSNLCIASHVVGTVITAVNSAVNFFVFFWRSTRFKQVLRQMCGGFCKGNRTKNKSVMLPDRTRSLAVPDN